MQGTSHFRNPYHGTGTKRTTREGKPGDPTLTLHGPRYAVRKSDYFIASFTLHHTQSSVISIVLEVKFRDSVVFLLLHWLAVGYTHSVRAYCKTQMVTGLLPPDRNENKMATAASKANNDQFGPCCFCGDEGGALK